MKALVFSQYGSTNNLNIKDVPRPVPKAGQVLVKTKYAAMNAGDWHLLYADPFLVRLMFGLFKPKITILGVDVCGEVVEVGPECRTLKRGDIVFGDLSNEGFGSYAEFVCASEKAFCKVDKKSDLQQYAGVSGAGMTAYDAVYVYAKVKKGDRVLVTGGSGGVGGFAIQMSKAVGAHVTALASKTKMTLVKKTGADTIIDYTTTDVLEQSQKYDVVIDCAAFRDPKQYRRILTSSGRYVLVGGSTKNMFRVMLLGKIWSKMYGIQFSNFLVNVQTSKLEKLRDMIKSGLLKTLVDKVISLAEVPKHMDYLKSGRARGKIIVQMDSLK